MQRRLDFDLCLSCDTWCLVQPSQQHDLLHSPQSSQQPDPGWKKENEVSLQIHYLQ